jgi:hypothetical protein
MFPQVAGLGAFAAGTVPGPHWVSLEAPSGRPVVLATTMVPGRLTLLVAHEDSEGSSSIYQYLPSLAPQTSSEPKPLRLLEMAQRFFQRGQLDPAYQATVELRALQWDDPVVPCLAGYLMLKRGRLYELQGLVGEILGRLDVLADTHVLAAEYLAARKDAAAARMAYVTALERGLPLFAEGLVRLSDAVETLGIAHPRAALLEELMTDRLPGEVWSIRRGLPEL